ncbi:metal ABC transporter substrate-binding protein [Candidatus Bipolaricaulota sp. J31]
MRVRTLIFLFALGAAALGAELKVAVSIPPLADFVRGVGGDRVEVGLLVPPGADPHTYELQPSQMRFLAEARLLVVVGLGFEWWLEDVVSAAGNPRLEVVVTSEGIDPVDGDPHIWLDPLNAVLQVATIRDALVRADPDGRLSYELNAAHYISELLALHRGIEARVARWSHREFVALHGAWAYFARRYGLAQLAVIEPSPGREPSPREVARIMELVRARGVRAIFVEEQHPPGVAGLIARETGAALVALDPLGGVPGREDYFSLMHYNLSRMEGALE